MLKFLRSDEQAAAADTTPALTLANLPELIKSFTDSGLAVTLSSSGDLDKLHPSVSAVAYRVVQEGLTNASKHGALKTASLTLTSSAEGLNITVTNPISGAESNQADNKLSGLGLVGVKERVRSVDGSVQYYADEEAGFFTLTAFIPAIAQRQQ